MAAEHLSAEELHAAARGSLPPPARLRLSDHLATCADCRARLRELSGRPLERAEEDEEITYELLADYLDQQLDPLRRETVRRQLATSPEAAADLRSLARFRAETNAEAAGLTKAEPERKVVAFPRTLARWLLPLAAVLVIALGGLWWSAQAHRPGALVSRAELRNLPPDLRAAVLDAAQNRRLRIPPEIVSLGSAREKLAGAPDAPAGFRLVRPRATAVRETQPHFTWTRRAGATSYRILVSETRSGRLVASGRSTQPSWQMPLPLARGQVYEWQVQALRGHDLLERVPRPPEPEARFVILSEAGEQEFAAVAKRETAAPFILAVAAARLGLLDVAEEQLQQLSRTSASAQISKTLSAQIEAARASSAP